MSSNISNTAQTDAVAMGSDTDSVISLAQRASEMMIDESSSPVQSTASSQAGGPVESVSSGSDADEDTIIKNSAVVKAEDVDDENVYVCYDKAGNRCDEYTTYDQFLTWQSYKTFCEMGPQLTIRFAMCNDDEETIGYIKKSYPMKLLCDFGGYFAALRRSEMAEKDQGYVDMDDVCIDDFEKLMMLIEAGFPLAKINLGPTYRTLTTFLKIYILADRFMMPMIKAWATANMEEYLQNNIGWPAVYQHEVVDHPCVGAHANAYLIHQEKLLDINDAWVRSEILTDDNRPIQKNRLQQYIVSYCPQALLHDTLDKLHPSLVFKTFKDYLAAANN